MLDQASAILPAYYRPVWLVRLVAIFLLVLLGSAAFPSASHAHGLHALQPDLSQQMVGESQQADTNQAATQEKSDCALGCCLVGSCLTVISTAATHGVALHLHAATYPPGFHRWEIFDTGAVTKRPPKA